MSSLATGKILQLTRKLSPGDTSLYADRDIGVTSGRLFFQSEDTVEWLSFSGVSLSGSEYVYANLVRQLSQTAIPATSTGTGFSWLATQEAELVYMHDQMMDKTTGQAAVYANAAARDAAITSPQNGMQVYLTAEGYFTDYVGGAWIQRATGATPNASTTVAGKVEEATLTEGRNGTQTGGTGAELFLNPKDAAQMAQESSWVYATSADVSDTYTASFTPAITAYVAGMRIRVKFTTVNIGACTLNVNGLGAKSIKLIDGTDPLDGDIAALSINELIYDGTNFILQGVAVRAVNTDVTTGTNTLKFITPYQFKLTGCQASNTLQGSSNGNSTITAPSSGIAKEIWLANIPAGGTIRVKFDLVGSNSSRFQTYIRRNGVQVGATRSESTTPTTYTEDINVQGGDSIQIYCNDVTQPGTVTVSNFQILFDIINYPGYTRVIL